MHQNTWNFASRVLPASVCKHCRKAGSSYMSMHCSMVQPDLLPSCDCTAVTVSCRAYCSVFHTFLAPTCKPMIPFAHCQDEITLFQTEVQVYQEAYKICSTNIHRICSINTKLVLHQSLCRCIKASHFTILLRSLAHVHAQVSYNMLGCFT